MQVHGAARLLGHRLRHERGIHLVPHRRLAGGALEQKGLVGEAHGVAVQQVDFHLRGAGLMDQGIDFDVLGFAERIHVVEQRIELVDRGDAVRLAADFRAARAAHRRLQGIVGIDVGFHQEELELRRHHRFPAVRLVQIEHPPQHVARRHGDRPAVAVEAVMNDLGGGFRGPGHHPHGLRIRLQHDVDVGRIHGALIVRIVAGHRLQEYRLGQPHALLFGEFLGRHELAAGHAGHVRNDGFDFRDAVFFQELLNRAGHKSPFNCARGWLHQTPQTAREKMDSLQTAIPGAIARSRRSSVRRRRGKLR